MKFSGLVHVASLLLVTATTWAFEPIVQEEDNGGHNTQRGLQWWLKVNALELIEVFPNNATIVKVKDLVNGDTIVRAEPYYFNIIAAINGYIGSVRFAYNGNSYISNFAPYTFYAAAINQFEGLGYGTHTVTATPCLFSNGSVCLGTPYTVTFTISAPPVAPQDAPPVARPISAPVAPPVTYWIDGKQPHLRNRN